MRVRRGACSTNRIRLKDLLGRFSAISAAARTHGRCHPIKAQLSVHLTTFGTIEDGNEDDTFADVKADDHVGLESGLHVPWRKYSLLHADWPNNAVANSWWSIPSTPIRQQPIDAWWIPIKPNTDAAMMAAMAHYIFTNGLHDQKFIDQFCLGMDQGTMPPVVVNDRGIPMPGQVSKTSKTIFSVATMASQKHRNGPNRSQASKHPTLRNSLGCTLRPSRPH